MAHTEGREVKNESQREEQWPGCGKWMGDFCVIAMELGFCLENIISRLQIRDSNETNCLMQKALY